MLKKTNRVICFMLAIILCFTIQPRFTKAAVVSGDIPSDRLPPAGWVNTQWKDPDPNGWLTIDVTKFGLPANDRSINASQKIAQILEQTSGNRIIYFPAGTYYFKSNLTISTGNIILRGSGLDQTRLAIDAKANDINAELLFLGEISTNSIQVVGEPASGDQQLNLADASSLKIGDFIQLYGTKRIAWEQPSETQIFKVIGKHNQTIDLDMKIGLNYPRYLVNESVNGVMQEVTKAPKVREIKMIENVGVENLTVERVNKPTLENVNNINFKSVNNGFIRNIESIKGGRSHISINWSKDIVVERNVLHDAFVNDYGYAYGISINNGSTRVRVTNNKSWNLRHQILMQLGANHSVISYNSVEAPYLSYNDIAFHSTYAYMNLVEGNSYNESYADNSKEGQADLNETGPGNTWFRNNSKGTDVGTGSDATDTKRQNVIGNNVMKVAKKGQSHYTGANRVNGVVQWDELNETSAIPNSLYLTEKPDFFESKSWPVYGPGVDPQWGGANTLPAADRAKPIYSFEAIGVEAPTTYTNRDYLTDWTGSFSHSVNLSIDVSNPGKYNGDPSRIVRSRDTQEEVVWNKTGITKFKLKAYAQTSGSENNLKLLTSYNGINWSSVTPEIRETLGNWNELTYSLSNLPNVNYVKVQWVAATGIVNSPQLSQVEYEYKNIMTDDLNTSENWAKTLSHTAGIRFVANGTKPTILWSPDSDVVVRSANTSQTQSIVWKTDDLSALQLVLYLSANKKNLVNFFVSKDGTSWSAATTTYTEDAYLTEWYRRIYTFNNLEEVKYVKVEWPSTIVDSATYWSPQVTRLIMTGRVPSIESPVVSTPQDVYGALHGKTIQLS